MRELDSLKSVTDEMLGGLHAGESLKQRIISASKDQKRHEPIWRANAFRMGVPLTACAAMVLTAGVLMFGGQTGEKVRIDTHAAGVMVEPTAVVRAAADLPDNSLQLTLSSDAPSYRSLFANGSGGNFPLVGVQGRAYRMLKSPSALKESALGSAIGTVGVQTDEPSLAEAENWDSGLSSIADEGATIYAISGVSDKTAVAASVDGSMRVFQRVYYAGHGAMNDSLEDTLDVRGQVASLELSQVGTISDANTASDVMATLLDNASVYAQDSSSQKQSLTVTLKSGISFTLGVDGDVVSACGAWSCPEFFEAFKAAL